MPHAQTPTAMAPVLLASIVALVAALFVSGVLLARSFGARDPVRGRPFGLGALLAALIAAFLALAIGILTRGPVVRADALAATFLFAHRTSTLDQVMMLVSALGDGRQRTVATVLLAGYFLWRRRSRWALALAATMAAAAALVPAFKTAFHFARPSLLYSGADAFSFPSGHATSAAALYIVLAWIAALALPRRWKVAPWGLAALMIGLTGLSRLYVGAHWLSDVLAGLALGGALGVGGVILASAGKGPRPEGGREDAIAILTILIGVGAILGPSAFGKARRLYAPYLSRPIKRVVDPGHLGDPAKSPIAPPPSV